MKIAIILGTRPEIIKMSPVIKECIRREIHFYILHTNQHYSENLDSIFFSDLNLPQPKYNLRVGSGTHAQETGIMLMGIEKILIEDKPETVLVEGDTNTVLAGALAAAKLHIRVGHIEAGLRSYFRQMPEEINRVLTDHISDLLFAPTKKAKNILLGEGIGKRKIFVTGNTIVDAVFQNLGIAERKSKILKKFKLESTRYFLVTIHREENVDNEKRLEEILNGLKLVSKKYGLPLVCPIHPRTVKKIKEFKIKVPSEIKLIDPIGYLDFLLLEANSRLIFTDSGGIQEESCILEIPCVTLRNNTERPETIDVGSNILAGENPESLIKAAEVMLNRKRKWKHPYGNGMSAERIINLSLKT